ncbi:MAG: response regulator [Halarcobacter sp.]
MKYLVVDDAKLARKMTIKSLKAVINKEFEVIEATNGKEAIEYYKTYNPEVCFMDLTMPEVNGFEATKEICSINPDAQIIIVSADIQEHSLTKAQESGAMGFIKKPIDANNLKSMMEELGLL